MGQHCTNMGICYGEPPIKNCTIVIPFLCGFSHSSNRPSV